MFTGIVEAVGQVREILPQASGKEFWIETTWKNPDLEAGDSVAISGACMTVTQLKQGGNHFQFYASFQSLALTNLDSLVVGDPVNLERAMTASQRFGGHMVQGHVDGRGKILSHETKDASEIYWVSLDPDLRKYLVQRGSITVDGISLTVVFLEKDRFQLVLIPETMRKTNAHTWKPGSVVNLEVDILAKYIENYLAARNTSLL